MRVLLDSGVWWRFAGKLPMKKALTDFLANDVTEWWLSPFAVAEMLYKVKHKKTPRAAARRLARGSRAGLPDRAVLTLGRNSSGTMGLGPR